MKIVPLGRTQLKPPVLLVPKWKELTAYTEWGIQHAKGSAKCFQLLQELQNCTLYVANSLRDLLYATGSGCWQAELWKDHVVSMTLDGTRVKVTSLRRILDVQEGDEARFQSVLELTGWLGKHNVPPGSISAMAWSLWRSTLNQELNISFDGDIGREGFYGGRQESTPGTFKNMVALDISSAYPYEMARTPYAARLRPVSTRTRINPNQAGLVVAAVKIDPNLPHSPLPSRLSEELIEWKTGELVGSWTWREIHAAMQLGCKVEILKNFAPLEEIQPFDKWWEVVKEGRNSLSPTGAKLVKALSNSLWGMFAMTGDSRGLVRWTDDLGYNQEAVPRKNRKMPQANTAHIAAETTSRVRVRMLMEGLYGAKNLAPNFPVHIDTDGILIPRDSLKHFTQELIGAKSGQWRVKQEIHKVEVRGTQLYRYTCNASCAAQHGWHYVAAGMKEKQAQKFFSTNPGLTVSINGATNNLAIQREMEKMK